jgi:hypothetical protein
MHALFRFNYGTRLSSIFHLRSRQSLDFLITLRFLVLAAFVPP